MTAYDQLDEGERAKDQGRKAHNMRLGTQNNPYPVGSRRRREWFAGWCLRNAECAAMNLWDHVNPMGEASKK